MGSPTGDPSDNDQDPLISYSLEHGIRPNPKIKDFSRGKAPWRFKGKVQNKKFIYDLEEDTIIHNGYKGYEDIPVSNRFTLLDDSVTQFDDNYDFVYNSDSVHNSDYHNKNRLNMFINKNYDVNFNFNFNNLDLISTNKDFNATSNLDLDVNSTITNDSASIIQYNPSRDSIYSDSISLNDKCYNYEYMRNKNFCSGYFPSFITLHDPKLNQISKNNNINNISDNYYLKIKYGMYLKQVTNSNSKYNLNYINGLKSDYQEIINNNTESKILISNKDNNDNKYSFINLINLIIMGGKE